MTKLKFLLELEKNLSALPQEDIEERLTFYSEMIEDRVEEGISEEDAVAQIGNIEEIAAQILADHKVEEPAFGEETVTAEGAPVTEPAQPKSRMKAWEITFLVLGSPIWLSLLIGVIAIVFSAYVSLWSVIISLWAVFVSLAACAVALPIGGIAFICNGYVHYGLAGIAASLVCGGLAVFLFFGCKLTTKGIVILTKKLTAFLKKRVTKKEEE